MSMMPLTAALVLSNKALLEQAQSCIQNLPVRIALEQVEEVDSEALLDRLERHRVDVVLVEAGKLTLPLEEVVRRLKNTATQPAVFVVHTEASPQLILESLRAGASEYLFPPLQQTLREAFERLSASRTKSGAGLVGGLGKIFGFISAKGGCGATTFACNIASNVSKALGQPLLLADMDFEAGLIRFIMKTKTTYSVRDAIDNMHRMDSSYWKALISSHPHKLDIIPAPDDIAIKHPATGEEIVHLMRFIRSSYPAAVIDFGRCYNAAAIGALQEMDAFYLVTSPDTTALTHSRRALEAFETGSNAASKVSVLLNKVPERGSPDRKHVEQMLGRPAAHSFVNDFASLYDAYSEGHLLDTSSSLGKQLHNFSGSLARRIRGEEEKPVNSIKPEAKGAKKWFSFLHRPSSAASPARDAQLSGKD